MLATGLAVIKIIGIILLGILGLLLAVIMLVLFVPVRYRVEGSRYEELKVSIRACWLLHILSFRAVYDGELVTVFKIFGIRFRGREDKETVSDAVRDAAGEAAGEYVKEPFKKQIAEVKAEREEKDREEEDRKEDTGAAAKPEEETHQEAARDAPGKKTFPFSGMYDKLKGISEKAGEIIAVIRKEEAVLKLLWKRFRALLRHILPRRIKGKIRFGFEDPYVTGQILTYISPFYAAYAGRLTVIPVFEEPVLDGELMMAGRIRIGTILWAAVMLWREPDIRRIWKQWHG